MARVYTTTSRAGGRLASSADRARLLPRSSAPTRRRSRTGRATRRPCSSSACSSWALLYAIQRLQGHLFLNPDHLKGVPAHIVAEHGGELRHEHELAVLRRRVHDVVPDPDGRARGAELRLGRRRHGGPRRGRARPLAPLAQRARQLLASTSTARSSTSCCRSRSILAVILISQGVPQTFHGARDGDDARGRAADDRARSGRLADRDQAARHERRRLLQLELGRPVREPERADELPRAARDPADPGGPGVHVREDGARAAARLDGVRGDVRHLRDRRRRQPPGRAARLAGAARTPA